MLPARLVSVMPEGTHIVKFLLLVNLIFLISCAVRYPDGSPMPSDPSIESLSGTYYRGDHLGNNTNLTLQPDGGYEAWTHSCTSEQPKELGTWVLKTSLVSFLPTTPEPSVRRELRTPHQVLLADGEWVLVRPADLKDYSEFRSSGFSKKIGERCWYHCFARKDGKIGHNPTQDSVAKK